MIFEQLHPAGRLRPSFTTWKPTPAPPSALVCLISPSNSAWMRTPPSSLRQRIPQATRIDIDNDLPLEWQHYQPSKVCLGSLRVAVPWLQREAWHLAAAAAAGRGRRLRPRRHFRLRSRRSGSWGACLLAEYLQGVASVIHVKHLYIAKLCLICLGELVLSSDIFFFITHRTVHNFFPYRSFDLHFIILTSILRYLTVPLSHLQATFPYLLGGILKRKCHSVSFFHTDTISSVLTFCY